MWMVCKLSMRLYDHENERVRTYVSKLKLTNNFDSGKPIEVL
jgi:hypothetical protein